MLGTLSLPNLKQLIEGIGASAFVIDVLPDGGFRYVATNARLEEVTGFREPLAGKRPTEVLPPACAAQVEANYRRCAETGTVLEYEEEVPVPSGRHWWRTVLVPLFNRNRQVFRIIATSTNITERKKAEIALQEHEALLREVLQALPVGVWITDAKGRIVFGNPAGQEIWRGARYVGLDEYGEYKGWWTDTGKQIAPEEWALARAVSRGESSVGEIIDIACFDGSRKTIINSAVPIRDAQGRVTGAIVVNQDITERRMMERALEAARDELEQRVEDRTRDLRHEIAEREQTEQALQQAKRTAEQANAAKSRFLAAASHDLRQPLQAQVFFHEALSRRNHDPELDPLLAKMGQAVQAQQQMLNALLDISRLDAGIVEVDKIDFPIGAVLDRLADEFAPQAEDRGLQLRCVRSTAIVHSDPALLERILRNLLANAIRYTERGRILLGCRRAGGRLEVQVWDTGRGIPADQLSAIFEEFHQVDNPARERSKGLGLGLAIVDRLAKLIDSRIAVRSWPGRGTVFEVDAAIARAAPELSAAGWGTAPEAGHAGAWIAVIDDDPDLLQALELSLEASGYDVAAADSGEAAVAAFQRLHRTPSVIVADYRLAHGATGSQAIQRLQAAFGAPIPGILLTGDTSPERLREAAATGFDLVHKPIQPDELLRLFNRFL